MTVKVDDPNRHRIGAAKLQNQIRRSVVVVRSDRSSPTSNSFAQGPQDEWDEKMKENYEAGGELKTRAEKALENYRTGNTSPLP